MKIQYKFALYVFSVVLLLLLATSSLFYLHNKQIALSEAANHLRHEAIKEASHLGESLKEKTKLVVGMTLHDEITAALMRSNAEYAALDEDQREKRLVALNDRWREATSSKDPFVQQYLDNPLAGILRQYQHALPDEIGEIFITNRYGLALGATTKLTTLTHRHKYWWQGAYDDGRGRIFFDDRGYDESVRGYVIGIVAPIRQQGEIIGIFKCNLRLQGTMTEFIAEISEPGHTHAILARSGGLIVFMQEAEPLSIQLPESLTKRIASKPDADAMLVRMHNGLHMVGYAPVALTYDDSSYGFGGTYKSIDQSKGNRGEGWYMLMARPFEYVLEPAAASAAWLIQVGLLFVMLAAAIALVLGRQMAQPIRHLTERAQRIGQGHLDEQLQVNSRDELGALADAFNQMSSDLKKTTVSRDSLEGLVEARTRELKDAQQEIVRKERLATLGQLTATISHELRNPLGSMRPSLYVLEKRADKDDERIQQAITLIDRSISRCDHIIDELLDYTRITNLDILPLRLDEWLQDLIGEQNIPPGIRAIINPGLAGVTCNADPNRLRRAVINVIENAVQAMLEEGSNKPVDDATLTISTRIAKNRINIVIEDTGGGIPEDIQQRIFEPLFSTKTFGVGLGMSVVKQIMTQHGGGIDIESHTTGNTGARITLWLPHRTKATERT